MTDSEPVSITLAGEEYNAWDLATMAGCAQPETSISVGAEWLLLVAESARDDVYPAILNDADEWDEAHQAADCLVPIYTHVLWETFVDLAAWQVDLSDYAPNLEGGDIEAGARLSLYVIAQALIVAVVEVLRDAEGDDDE